MKKKATIVNQPDKVETCKSELFNRHINVQKLYRDHTFCDHPHGRVNRFPFGSDHGPVAF
jgi:hypothetical protein